VEATDDLMTAVEQIIQPSEKNAEQGIQVPDTQNTDELKVKEASEPTQETESEDTDEIDEDPSDDNLDGEYDDEDLVEEVAEADNLIPVKVNGKDEMWTLDQLKQSAAGQGYINKRMQEVASLEKEYKTQNQALAQQQKHVLAYLQNAMETGVKQPTLPDENLFQSDPIGYMEAKLTYDKEKATFDKHVATAQQMKQQQVAAAEQQSLAYTQQQAQLLTERLPEIADPEKGEAIKAGLMEAGDYYGFTQDEIASVRDHRYFLAMHDAMRYRQLVNKRGKATSTQKESLTPVKAGAKRRPKSGKVAARSKAQSRLQKTGSINDALNLILDS